MGAVDALRVANDRRRGMMGAWARYHSGATRANAAISGSFEARARGAANAAKDVGVMIAEVVERVTGRGTR